MNIYNLDRQAAVDSFQCYWQIDYMFRKLKFGVCPIVERARIDDDSQSHRYEKLCRCKIKCLYGEQKVIQLPQMFFKPTFADKKFEYKGYRTFIPKNYVQDKKKESQWVDR